MFVYIVGLIGFIIFIYYSYFRFIKVTYKDTVSMFVIILLPLLTTLMEIYNTTLYITIFTVISLLIIYIYIKKLEVKTRIILIGFTILKYALYSNLIAFIIYKCTFDFILKYNYSLEILSNGYFIIDTLISIISIGTFIVMYYKFMNTRIKNKYIYLNKQYKYCVYVTINYCIDNIIIAHFLKWIFISENSMEIVKYIMFYTLVSELIIQNILIKAELSYTKYNLEVSNNQLENQIKHYSEYEKYMKKVRYIAHDIKKHKFALNQLVASKKHEEAKDFIYEIDKEIEAIDCYFVSEHILMDALIKNKIKVCEKYGIKLKYDIFIPKDIHIKNMHISIIFNNLIDNAIEACMNVEDNKREKYIHLYCDVIDSKLICVIKNSKNKKPLELDKSFKIETFKKDKTNHGIGIENLKLTIEKYEGVIDFNIEEYCFTVKFIIPI
ncbi:GHKL domain-containing protein [Paraclostridium benzoelyticum]|uniref:sensor histidine kinase n=1 Tax=Paraclostridium benzoelyticum TaxID=1629550 RepID=UPI0031CD22F2